MYLAVIPFGFEFNIIFYFYMKKKKKKKRIHYWGMSANVICWKQSTSKTKTRNNNNNCKRITSDIKAYSYIRIHYTHTHTRSFVRSLVQLFVRISNGCGVFDEKVKYIIMAVAANWFALCVRVFVCVFLFISKTRWIEYCCYNRVQNI